MANSHINWTRNISDNEINNIPDNENTLEENIIVKLTNQLHQLKWIGTIQFRIGELYDALFRGPYPIFKKLWAES